MKMQILVTSLLILIISFNSYAQTDTSQSDLEQITATLMDYIEGTANGEPERLRRAFHPDFNLYTVTQEDSLRIVPEKNTFRVLNRAKSLTDSDG